RGDAEAVPHDPLQAARTVGAGADGVAEVDGAADHVEGDGAGRLADVEHAVDVEGQHFGHGRGTPRNAGFLIAGCGAASPLTGTRQAQLGVSVAGWDGLASPLRVADRPRRATAPRPWGPQSATPSAFSIQACGSMVCTCSKVKPCMCA